MVYLRHLVALYPSLVVRCVVCNLRPARKRAALMRQTLDALNMKHVPVGVGDEVVPPSRARDDDEDWAFIDAGAYASALRAAHFSPHSVNVAGVRHQVVGRGDAATGVRDADALRKALADGIRDGIARAPGAARRAAR